MFLKKSWLLILIATIIFECVGINRYQFTRDNFDLWFWGIFSFIGITIELIVLSHIINKQYKNSEQ